MCILCYGSVAACTTMDIHKPLENIIVRETASCEAACRMVLPDGSTYLGPLKNGRPNGQGKLSWQNGSHYEGGFEDGQMHGDGILTADNGDKYVGEFVRDMLQGDGIFSFANGSKYTGTFKGNAFDGYGILTKPNGDEYVGGFANNLFDGNGILYFSDPQGRKRQLAGTWDQGRYDTQQGEIDQASAADDLSAEVVLFYQHQMLSQLSEQIATSRPGITDLYFVSFGSDDDQDVFMKEVIFTKELFESQYGLKDRIVQLINNKAVVHDIPIASIINLKIVLQMIAQRMDVEEDILFLYLTSHGSRDHTLSIRLGGIPLANLPADTLAEILEESGIQWKVIAISACYSGGFIDHLKNQKSMIMTSSRADRTSFGCSDDSDMTYFGRAFFQHALEPSTTFVDAFTKAREIVALWEERDDFIHSEPQIYSSPLIEDKLKAWRNTLDQKVAAGNRPN